VNLRRQLLIVSLLLLALPWAGCQFVREMEGALRNGQEQSLQATAQAVATLLGEQPQLLYPNIKRRTAPQDDRRSIFASPAEHPVAIDGYGDGWEDIKGIRFSDTTSQGLSVTILAQTRDNYLYLLLKVKDPEVIYHNPGLSREANGDRLILRMWMGDHRQDYVIATSAPGSVRAKAANRRQPGIDPGQIRGYWQDAIEGYTLELEIPLEYTGARLGFFIMNEESRSGQASQSLGNITPLDTAAPPWLIYSPVELQNYLAPFSGALNQIRIIDKHNWLIADLPASSDINNATSDTFWLVQLLYRAILSQDVLTPPPADPLLGKVQGTDIDAALAGKAAHKRYRDPDYRTRTILSAAAPIEGVEGVLGAVVVQQSSETYLSLTDKAFSRLLGYSLLALGIGALGMLGYASLLSWRIGKLSRAARNAIGEDGRMLDNFPRSIARDEIGDLSRRYADLLGRVREYNNYLHSLSRKLSHELRTPIAVIQTSLDNLEHGSSEVSESEIYLRRAREGLSRLQRILTAMSEANGLEESIRNNQLETVDLAVLLRDVFETYGSVYPKHLLKCDIPSDGAWISCAPDLIVQALDKLMDNAASFCPVGGVIELCLAATVEGWEIRLCNEGPTLPSGLQDRLFNPMVSLREAQSNEVHLGLGLHIVRLIVEFHHGRVMAQNLPDNQGVVISILLPGMPSEASS
jgi:dedicated sortase system histidine kinase